MKNLPSLRQLRYLVALSEARHFRKAAEAMGISQPSLSLQISNLEGLLGVLLVERGRGPVTLTPEGREVLTRAARIVDEVHGIIDLTEILNREIWVRPMRYLIFTCQDRFCDWNTSWV